MPSSSGTNLHEKLHASGSSWTLLKTMKLHACRASPKTEKEAESLLVCGSLHEHHRFLLFSVWGEVSGQVQFPYKMWSAGFKANT